MKIVERLSTAIKGILDAILPQRCLACRKTGEIICDECLYKLPNEANVYGITTIFSYSDPTVQRAIWLLKYRGVREAAKPLAKVIYERLLEELSSETELTLAGHSRIVLIPVPLSRERQGERGFNQSEILGREIVNLDEGHSFELRTDILKKTKNTPSQVSIKNRTQRIKNLEKVFALERRDELAGRVVVILDDVTTTGTTLNECAKVLRRAKPARIIKVAAAH